MGYFISTDKNELHMTKVGTCQQQRWNTVKYIPLGLKHTYPGGFQQNTAKKSREQSTQQEEAEDREDEDGQVGRWRTEGNDKGTVRRGIKCADGVTVVVKLRKTVWCPQQDNSLHSSFPSLLPPFMFLFHLLAPYHSLALPPSFCHDVSLPPSVHPLTVSLWVLSSNAANFVFEENQILLLMYFGQIKIHLYFSLVYTKHKLDLLPNLSPIHDN